MAGIRRRFCVDTCIFLMREGDASYRQEVRLATEDLFRRFDANQLDLLTSAITCTEVLAVKSPTTHAYLEGLRGRRNFLFVNCDPVVAAIASDLRCDYKVDYQGKDGQWRFKTISTPDSIHLASAIAYGIEEFLTVEDRSDSETRGLLGLGQVEHKGHTLQIREPYLINPVLGLFMDEPSPEAV